MLMTSVVALALTVDPAACVKVLDGDTVSIRRQGSAQGEGDFDIELTLGTRHVADSRRPPGATRPKVFTREASVDEVEAVLRVLRPLCLTAEVLDPGTGSGSVDHFLLTQRDGGVRLLGTRAGAPLGHPPYFVVPSTVSSELGLVFPVADTSQMPPPVEQALATFVQQVVSGRPELTLALLRLDPKKALFDASVVPVAGQVHVELRAKKGSGLSVAALARTLGLQRPLAVRVGSGWRLGEATGPLQQWKGALLEVQLTLPSTARPPRATLEGAMVEAIVVQAPRP